MAVLTTKFAYKNTVVARTTQNIALTYETFPIIDGVTLKYGDRILVMNQTNAVENGIYFATTHSLNRDVDANIAESFVSGGLIKVTGGTTHSNTEWYIQPIPPANFNTANKSFVASPYNASTVGGSIVPITSNELSVLYNNGTMVSGTVYSLNDGADAGILIKATSATTLENTAIGFFKNPDFQRIGNYSGVFAVTGVAYTSTIGVWNAANESTYVAGDIVFWNGIHYQVTDPVAFDTTNPSVSTAYTILPKNLNNVGYVTVGDKIVYNIGSKNILERSDIYGNKIFMPVYTNFQFGNANNAGNIVEYATLNCINFSGSVADNHVICGAEVILNESNGIGASVQHNIFNGLSVGAANGTFLIIDLPNSGLFRGNIIESNNTFVFDKEISNRIVNMNHSNISETYDATGLTTLDITSQKNYVGNVAITTDANSAVSIDTINNFPTTGVPVRFYSTGNIVTFVNNSGAGNLICKDGSNAVIGAAGGFIEFTFTESYPGSGIFGIYETNRVTY